MVLPKFFLRLATYCSDKVYAL